MLWQVILSAILLILAFPNFNLTYLAFIGFIPLFFAIQNTRPRKAFFVSYLCGFFFYLGTLYWLYHVTVIGLIVLCLYLALYFGIFGLIFNRITLHFTPYTFLLVSFSWVILEYIQSHLFTGFGWILMGYSQYKNLPLIQIADFSGVYGVSFVIMMVNVAIYRILRIRYLSSEALAKEDKLYAVRYTLLILILVYGYGFFRLNEAENRDTVKVSVIQGNIEQDLKWDPRAAKSILDKYVSLTREAAQESPDLIVWPETSFPGFLITDKNETDRVFDLVNEVKTPILIGANTEKGPKVFNSAVLISERGEIIDKYDKIHLVPFGEYVPFSYRFPVLHNLVLGELGEFSAGEEFKIFRIQHPASNIEAKLAVLICYEDIFPELAKRFVRSGAEFLVVITNDAWYGKSAAAYQHAACSVFRAIENRISIVRCANTGYSCFIDSKGKIYDSVEEDNTHLFVTGYKTSSVYRLRI
ncbi:MAG: apolipoprotein N-acyltransferase [Candidatus Omnitrophica bacterium]|nr:apolipoprotein N-acyltransferase [Candidatus Omnitrophota bacterium]